VQTVSEIMSHSFEQLQNNKKIWAMTIEKVAITNDRLGCSHGWLVHIL